MTRKLLVTDLDGTVAHRDRIPSGVASSCAALAEDGWEIMVATGRILATALPHIEALGAAGPAIVYDGARIMESRTGEVLFERFLDSDTAGEALEEGWEEGLCIQVFGDESVILRPGDDLSLGYFRGTSVPVRARLVSPSVSFPVYRVIFFGDPPKVRELARRLEQRLGERASVTLAGEGFLDVLGPGISKGRALEHYLGILGKAPDLLVCAGDHLNDVELLQLADIAAVPADAPREIRRPGQIVFPAAEEGGFAELARRLLEGLSPAYPCKRRL